MTPRRFLAVLAARNKEFFRDRAALGWNIVMPFLLLAGFALAFSSGPRDIYKVGVYDGGAGETRPDLAFFHTRYIQFVPVADLAAAIAKVQHHQLDMLFDLSGEYRYWINPDAPNGYILERLLTGDGQAGRFARQTAAGREIRYVDWVVAGVLAMNMMFSALYGVGYVIVRYRKEGVLKRLKATPLTAFEFLAAQVASRLGIILITTSVIFLGCRLLIDVSMHGSHLALLAIFAMGAVSLISLGLVTAARLASQELADGIVNLISWPMMFLSGVWFSLEGAHPLMRQLAQLLPLTHVIDAARAVMLDGAGLADIAPHIAVLAAMSAAFMALGTWLFRWE
ncbi:MAG: ABC transporter permease [Pseudomonadota bacterium]|nr:ABC transporter permease [Pseudomonadota bacterium]